MKRKAILLHAKDDVATALADLRAGEVVALSLGEEWKGEVTLLDDVRLGHKFALRDIKEGEDVLKYGMPIGRATKAIRLGQHVHTHNLVSSKE